MGTRPVRVRITYCSECGYEGHTLELVGALMRTFGHDLAAIEIIPWFEGSFDVSVDGELVHAMYRDGGIPEVGAIVDAVRARLQQRV